MEDLTGRSRGYDASVHYNWDEEVAPAIAGLSRDDYGAVTTARAAHDADVAKAKATVDATGVAITERTVNCYLGSPAVRVRLYTPEQRATRVPALLNIHGGGYVVGSPDTDHATSVLLARELGVVVGVGGLPPRARAPVSGRARGLLRGVAVVGGCGR